LPTSVETDAPAAADRDTRTARLVLLLFVGALLVALVGGALLVVAERHHDNQDDAAATGEPASADGAVRTLGPIRGAPVANYVAARNQVLAGATGTRLAVVSFTRYATEAEARRAVGAARVLAVLVAAPGGQPDTVTDNLKGWAADARQQALRQRADIQQLLNSGTVDDPDYLSFYRSEVARFTRLAASVNPDQPLVFAVVVTGPVDVLRGVARAPGVRLVDVGTSDKQAPGAALTGLRPEETSAAGTPPTRP
jgi:hypothetical protein